MSQDGDVHVERTAADGTELVTEVLDRQIDAVVVGRVVLHRAARRLQTRRDHRGRIEEVAFEEHEMPLDLAQVPPPLDLPRTDPQPATGDRVVRGEVDLLFQRPADRGDEVVEIGALRRDPAAPTPPELGQ
ncbi:hypothetical protein [Streptomyces sp. NPDC005374]|uniref:hypothetical protein n=1 Tax=Streptomyces sp. NPDC005374 TaxID=3364713 RepID=UPI0036A38CAB